MSPLSMYLVKYNASPGLPPSLYDANRGYGLINEALMWLNATKTPNNFKNKHILLEKNVRLMCKMFSLFSDQSVLLWTRLAIRFIWLLMLNCCLHRKRTKNQCKVSEWRNLSNWYTTTNTLIYNWIKRTNRGISGMLVVLPLSQDHISFHFISPYIFANVCVRFIFGIRTQTNMPTTISYICVLLYCTTVLITMLRNIPCWWRKRKSKRERNAKKSPNGMKDPIIYMCSR